MARLTEEQKKMLDKTIIDKITSAVQNGQTTFQAYSLYTMIANDLDFCITNPVCSIDYAMARIRKSNYPIMNGYNHTYTYNANAIIIDDSVTTFRKEKNKIFFDCHPDLFFDFETKKLSVKEEDIYCRSGSCFIPYVFNSVNIEKMGQYEWLFNYTTDLYTIMQIIKYCPTEAYEKMPKGFYEVLKENNNQISDGLLNDYYYKIKYGKFSKLARYLIEHSNPYEDLEYFTENYSMDFLFNMLKNRGYVKKEDIINDLEISELSFWRYIQEIKAFIYNFNLPYELIYDRKNERYYLTDLSNK